MWLDNASDIDILFYGPYAKLIDQIVKTKQYNPLTIGLFGLWGAGKSTLLELIKTELDEEKNNIACIQLNAWMFEGYEDAKVALMEALLNQLRANESKFSGIKDKLGALLRRIDYFKLGTDIISKGAPLAASIVSGNPIPLLLSLPSDIDGKKVGELISGATNSVKEFKDNYVKDPNETTVENIRKFRDEFECALEASKIDNVIVLVDDLDRCNPDRIIDTLEAIKLFLSVKRTTFIIAADETVIQYAIKRKFPPIDGSSVEISKEYIEKIIQLPIHIPELSSKDIENYLLLLIAQLYLKEDDFVKLIKKLFEEEIVVRESCISLNEINDFIDSLGLTFKSELDNEQYLKNSEVITNIKAIVSATLKGNPRQAKRFLNTFMTKRNLADMYFKDGVDVQVLAKMLALQKINRDLFKELNEWNKEFDIENKKLKDIYMQIKKNPSKVADQLSQWAVPRVINWMEVEPKELYKINLDKYFYLSREELKNNISINGLSERAKNILEKIGLASEATIENIMIELREIEPGVLDEVITTLLPKIKDGELEWYVIRHIFESAKGYRGKIMQEIKVMPKIKLGLPCVPYLKKMLIISNGCVKPILDEMKSKNLKESIYKKIIAN
ncbi:MAG: KAP family NTPase [Anaeromicrobium sp.]|jgi:predicted KAP-like P-loop ATPase|uniref:KAP family P-loop NTPase fold protein n=1 Tax=Anaeromicrobium sp. TaxID=1929132 RepID=UPI0025DC7D11|nr:P-loop NTPase fold protein [Anaeromicrobium sp.]MCT4592809.1 KAP family NTPase [Anaeromicrobium sp.]